MEAKKVSTREKAMEYRMNHWTQVMQERAESGKSIKAYCESKGLHENVYYYWQRKLREAALKTEQNESVKIEPVQQTGTIVATPQGWALCEVKKPEPKSSTVEIEIGKSRITVHAETDQEILAKVCRLLVSLC